MEVLTALSPLDGRYRTKIEPLAEYFSEYGLFRYRLLVEVEYFLALHAVDALQLPALDSHQIQKLKNLYQGFSLEAAQRIKEIEKETNHDVKAVEYYIKESIETWEDAQLQLGLEYIHFGLTSQDINNTAIPMSLRDAIAMCYLPLLEKLNSTLHAMGEDWKSVPMLARTHGQAATPTTVGKELWVFVSRLKKQIASLKQASFPAKFGGATGSLNAHYAAFPDVDWEAFAQHFVEEGLGLTRSYPTTQIEHYDGLAAIFDNLKRINTILIDLCQDCWLYISQEYFKQKVKAREVGSSAMPHKVNPIDFENAEGNCGLATAMLEFLSRKLPVSRLQRDLTDSTILRNVGVALGYGYLALQSVLKGLEKLELNEAALALDLADNWAVLAEPIQTILRREGYPQPYETLKSLTRGKTRIDQEVIHEFIHGLEVSEAVKKQLLALRPDNYLGSAGKQFSPDLKQV